MRELQDLVDPNPPQGVLVRGHAGLAINEFYISIVAASFEIEYFPSDVFGVVSLSYAGQSESL